MERRFALLVALYFLGSPCPGGAQIFSHGDVAPAPNPSPSVNPSAADDTSSGVAVSISAYRSLSVMQGGPTALCRLFAERLNKDLPIERLRPASYTQLAAGSQRFDHIPLTCLDRIAERKTLRQISGNRRRQTRPHRGQTQTGISQADRGQGAGFTATGHDSQRCKRRKAALTPRRTGLH